jgi:hypothetical protein
MENNLHNIEFTFNYTNKTFNMTLEHIIYEANNSDSNNINNINHSNNSNEIHIKQTLKTLKTIIKEECYKNDIILTEANIVLYDFENDYIINTINDLIINKTKTCSIMIIPVKCDNHLY